jgi:hypothetical protein
MRFSINYICVDLFQARDYHYPCNKLAVSQSKEISVLEEQLQGALITM